MNKESGGGNKSGSGRGKKDNHAWSRKGGREERFEPKPREKRSAAARKGWETRHKRANG